MKRSILEAENSDDTRVRNQGMRVIYARITDRRRTKSYDL